MWKAQVFAAIVVVSQPDLTTNADASVRPEACTPSFDEDAHSSEVAAAVVKAIQVNDKAIRSVRWTQKTYVPSPGSDALMVLQDGRFGFDERHRWYFDGLRTYSGAPGEPGGTQHERFFRDAMGGVWCYVPYAKRGSLRAAQEEDRSIPSPYSALGRALSANAPKGVGDLLQAATDLKVVGSSIPADENQITVRGLCELGEDFVEIVATVDLAKNGAIKSLVKRSALLGCPLERIENTKFAHIGGTWIPVAGWREVYSIGADDGASTERLNKAYKERGLPEKLDPRNRAHRESMHGILNEVFGGDYPFVEMIGNGRASFEVSAIMVNDGIDIERAIITYDIGADVLDHFAGVLHAVRNDDDMLKLRRRQRDHLPEKHVAEGVK